MDVRRLHIHWVWVPAAIVLGAAMWRRDGPLPTLLMVCAGPIVGVYGEWRARRDSRN